MNYDMFISHASEDKKEFVEPLANQLQAIGLSIWYDDFSLKIGDSLRESIDRGLASSSYGLVVLSPDFFKKNWPQRELGALFALQDPKGKIILPVWHNIRIEQIKKYSPMLADIVAVRSNQGMEIVIRRILEVVKPDLVRQKVSAISSLANLSALLRDYLVENVKFAEKFGTDIKHPIKEVQEALVILADVIAKVASASDPQEIWLNLDKAENLLKAKPAYCIRCRTKVKTNINRSNVELKNGRLAMRGMCPNCGTGLYQIYKFEKPN